MSIVKTTYLVLYFLKRMSFNDLLARLKYKITFLANGKTEKNDIESSQLGIFFTEFINISKNLTDKVELNHDFFSERI